MGTLEDEFALMSKENYLLMIQDAKSEFLQDIQGDVNKEDKKVNPDLFGKP